MYVNGMHDVYFFDIDRANASCSRASAQRGGGRVDIG